MKNNTWNCNCLIFVIFSLVRFEAVMIFEWPSIQFNQRGKQFFSSRQQQSAHWITPLLLVQINVNKFEIMFLLLLQITHRQLLSIHGPVLSKYYLPPSLGPQNSLRLFLEAHLGKYLKLEPLPPIYSSFAPWDTCSTSHSTRPGCLTSISQLNVPQAHQSYHR